MVLKKTVALLSICSTVMACQGRFKKPKNLIPKDKMVNILVDVELIKAARVVNRKAVDSLGIDNNYIFNKYHIDSLQLATSNSYYAYHAEEYAPVYTKIADSLEALQKKYKALVLREEKAAKQRQARLVKEALNSKIGPLVPVFPGVSLPDAYRYNWLYPF